MKSVMVVRSYPEPSEAFIHRQAAALRVPVWAEQIHPEFPFPAGIPYLEIPSYAHPLNGKSFSGKLRLSHNFFMHRNIDVMPSKEDAAFRQLLKRHRPLIVIAQAGLIGLRVMRPCITEKVPFIVHFHGYDLSSLYRRYLYRFSLKILIDYAVHLVVVNRVQNNRLIAIGCPQNRISLIPYGVPVDEFVATDSPMAQPCRFLSVGRFVAKKGPALVIKAFALCARHFPEVRLTMIGDGPLKGKTAKLVKELHLEGKVVFLGPQTNHQVKQAMAGSCVFLQHSITAPNGDEEGWPVAIAEAAASGLPIVATRHAAIPEQVVDGKTGFLVNEGDWDTMGRFMMILAGNPGLRQQMGKLGRKHIESKGNFQDQITELERVITLHIGSHVSSDRV